MNNLYEAKVVGNLIATFIILIFRSVNQHDEYYDHIYNSCLSILSIWFLVKVWKNIIKVHYLSRSSPTDTQINYTDNQYNGPIDREPEEDLEDQENQDQEEEEQEEIESEFSNLPETDNESEDSEYLPPLAQSTQNSQDQDDFSQVFGDDNSSSSDDKLPLQITREPQSALQQALNMQRAKMLARSSPNLPSQNKDEPRVYFYLGRNRNN